MLDKFKDTVKDFSESVKSAVAEKELDEDTLDPLLEKMRMKLLQNNVSLEAAETIEEDLRNELLGEEVQRNKVQDKIDEALEKALKDVLDDSFNFREQIRGIESPTVFFVGFNGSGKTTTTAKIAESLQNDGEEVVMGAGDTFRAASIEQLEKHGENLDAKVISHEYESDPAAVAYDAVEHAEKTGKVALVDTAGRSHADTNLMQELEKMVDVNNPDVTFLVVDALSGNDVNEQADAYEGMFDAIIVTKMDVDKNGGALLSIAQKTGKPVAYIGTGQDYDDLEEFDKESFVEDILE